MVAETAMLAVCAEAEAAATANPSARLIFESFMRYNSSPASSAQRARRPEVLF
jgi:hypothetical protein